MDFWKVLALGLFFASHGAVGFWKVLVRRSPGRCCGRFWLGKLTEQKKLKRHMVFPPFYSISLRCRLLEGFSFGFVFGFSLSCRLLEASWLVTQKGCVVEGSGRENELSKKSENATWFSPLCIVSQSGVGFWKV